MFHRIAWIAAWIATNIVFGLAISLLSCVIIMLLALIVMRWMLRAIGGDAMVRRALRPLRWLVPYMVAFGTWLMNPPPYHGEARQTAEILVSLEKNKDASA